MQRENCLIFFAYPNTMCSAPVQPTTKSSSRNCPAHTLLQWFLQRPNRRSKRGSCAGGHNCWNELDADDEDELAGDDDEALVRCFKGGRRGFCKLDADAIVDSSELLILTAVWRFRLSLLSSGSLLLLLCCCAPPPVPPPLDGRTISCKTTYEWFCRTGRKCGWKRFCAYL